MYGVEIELREEELEGFMMSHQDEGLKPNSDSSLRDSKGQCE